MRDYKDGNNIDSLKKTIKNFNDDCESLLKEYVDIMSHKSLKKIMFNAENHMIGDVLFSHQIFRSLMRTKKYADLMIFDKDLSGKGIIVDNFLPAYVFEEVNEVLPSLRSCFYNNLNKLMDITKEKDPDIIKIRESVIQENKNYHFRDRDIFKEYLLPLEEVVSLFDYLKEKMDTSKNNALKSVMGEFTYLFLINQISTRMRCYERGAKIKTKEIKLLINNYEQDVDFLYKLIKDNDLVKDKSYLFNLEKYSVFEKTYKVVDQVESPSMRKKVFDLLSDFSQELMLIKACDPAIKLTTSALEQLKVVNESVKTLKGTLEEAGVVYSQGLINSLIEEGLSAKYIARAKRATEEDEGYDVCKEILGLEDLSLLKCLNKKQQNKFAFKRKSEDVPEKVLRIVLKNKSFQSDFVRNSAVLGLGITIHPYKVGNDIAAIDFKFENKELLGKLTDNVIEQLSNEICSRLEEINFKMKEGNVKNYRSEDFSKEIKNIVAGLPEKIALLYRIDCLKSNAVIRKNVGKIKI